jgi:hypothetical protein
VNRFDPLVPADLRSPAWERLTRYLERRLADARERNDQPQSSEDTAALRGRIAELRFLLALPEYFQRDAQVQQLAQPRREDDLY